MRCDADVTRIEAGQVVIEGQAPVPAALCVGAAGAFPHAWIAGTDLPLKDGFIEVGPNLSVLGDDALFAVGDCAHMGFAPRPKAGVFAVRAAPVLHRNLRAALSGGVRRAFKPQKNYLKLISLGGKSAMAEKYGRTLSGSILWRWKDRIDRAFMNRLSDLPVMGQVTPRGEVALGVRNMLEAKPMCGGCGAKVGAGVLGEVLAELPPAREDVVAAVGDDAAIMKVGKGFQVISTDHLPAFVADPAQMARIAAVHALGDVLAMGAAPQVILSQVVLPQMSSELQARTLAEITQAAQGVAEEVGAQVVGGHTTMGAALTIGFTVTGLRTQMPITTAGAKDGDVLILTRPIGSGVTMAALMQGVADGRHVAGVLAIMQRSQHREAEVLKNAHAMTDVTGFGLAGHVREMAQASGLDAELWQREIPVYEGARALSEAGVASTLMSVNRADAPGQGVEDDLLYDPQTAGGLLAAVSADRADAVLAELAAAGCAGWRIGKFTAGSGAVTLLS